MWVAADGRSAAGGYRCRSVPSLHLPSVVASAAGCSVRSGWLAVRWRRLAARRPQRAPSRKIEISLTESPATITISGSGHNKTIVWKMCLLMQVADQAQSSPRCVQSGLIYRCVRQESCHTVRGIPNSYAAHGSPRRGDSQRERYALLIFLFFLSVILFIYCLR